MAHKVHIGQQFEDFLAFEGAIQKYQDAEKVQFFMRLAVFESCKTKTFKLSKLCDIKLLTTVFAAARPLNPEGQERKKQGILLCIRSSKHIKKGARNGPPAKGHSLAG